MQAGGQRDAGESRGVIPTRGCFAGAGPGATGDAVGGNLVLHTKHSCPGAPACRQIMQWLRLATRGLPSLISVRLACGSQATGAPVSETLTLVFVVVAGPPSAALLQRGLAKELRTEWCMRRIWADV